MCKLSSLLGIALLVSSVSAANVCKQGNVVHMPVGSQTYYWPSSWRENASAPRLATGQDCSWAVTVPTGYFAKLIIDGKTTDKDSRFQTIDAAGNFIQSTHETKQPYYFPPAKFTLIVSNEGTATFAFKIVWAKIPAVGTNHGVGTIPQLANATNLVFSDVYGTTNHLSLLAFPQDIHNYHSLRSVLVYEGNRNDFTYVSNLYLLFQTGEQYISSGDEIMIMNVEQSNSTDYFLVQNYDFLKNFHQYKALECNSNTNCTATINGGSKSSALVTVPHGNETLVDIQMNAAANVSIYFGSPNNNFDFYGTYSGTEIKNKLPMFCSWVMNFVISNGKAVFSFSA